MKYEKIIRRFSTVSWIVYIICCLFVLVSVFMHAERAAEYSSPTPDRSEVYQLAPDEICTQTLTKGKRTVREIAVLFDTNQRTNEGEITVTLQKNGSLVQQWDMDARDLKDGVYQVFRLDRSLRTDEEDDCLLTVQETYTGTNNVAVWTSGGGAFRSSSRGRVSDHSICYTLTLVDGSLTGGTLFLFAAGLLLLMAVPLVLVDFRRSSPVKIVAAALLCLLLVENVTTQVMQKVVRDVYLHDYESDNTYVKLDPGESLMADVRVQRLDFSDLEFSVSDVLTRSQSMHITLSRVEKDTEENEDTSSAAEKSQELSARSLHTEDNSLSAEGVSGVMRRTADITVYTDEYGIEDQADGEEEILFDGDLSRQKLYEGGPGGRRIRLSAAEITGEKLFPRGTYRIRITNNDPEKKLPVCAVAREVSAGGGNTADEAGGSSYTDTDSGESGTYLYQTSGESDPDGTPDDSELGFGTDPEETGDEEEFLPEENLSLNYAVVRSTKLGYQIALWIILLLGAYLVAVAALTTGRGWNLSHEKRITGFFLASVIPLSLIMMILMQPWNVPDTRAHIPAIYRISNRILGAGEEEEWNVRPEETAFFMDVWSNSEEDVETDQNNPDMKDYANVFLHPAGSGRELREELAEDPGAAPIGVMEKMKYYSVIGYLPQVIGLTLGRFLQLGAVRAIWLGRIFTLAAYIAACLHAIRITPVGKWIFAAIPLLPMCLMMSSAFSYDTMVIISSLCFTASVLRAADGHTDRRSILECAVWAGVIGAVKGGGYLLLLPLVLLLIPAKGAGDRLSAFIRRCLPVIAAGAASILLFDVILPSGSLYQFGEEGTGNLSFLYGVMHPMKYLGMLMNALFNYADLLTINVGGTYLGWLEKTIPNIFIVILLILIMVYAVMEPDSKSLTKRDRKILLAVIFLHLFLTPLMLLSWTPVGETILQGLQARYFLPILPLVMLILTKFRLRRCIGEPQENRAVQGVQLSCMRWFCVISCICVYYQIQMYLTR